MTNRDLLNSYVARIEKRLRLSACTQGVAVTAVILACATVLLVLLANHFAFSSGSVTGARLALIVTLVGCAAFALVLPLLRLNRRSAARWTEGRCRDFQERLLTFVEKSEGASRDPFLELLAADTMAVTPKAEPSRLVPPARIALPVAISLIGVAVLVWLLTLAPGFLGHGAALLWGATPRGGTRTFYDIRVAPGDATVRKGGDQMITAGLVGFQTPRVRLFARFSSASKWEEAAMSPQPNGPDFQFLFAGIPEPVNYYVEAGGLVSRHFKISVYRVAFRQAHTRHLPFPRLARLEGRGAGTKRRSARHRGHRGRRGHRIRSPAARRCAGPERRDPAHPAAG